MRTAIFGGTFDPIHTAHLVVAHEAAEAFALDRVLFIPAANPPHKEAGAPYEDRYRMVELACAADPRFVPSRLEDGTAPAPPSVSLAALPASAEPGSVVPASSFKAGRAVSYSIHTIERLRAPGETLYFIIGADAFAEIRSWRRWEEVVASVEFIVVTRPGHLYDSPPGARVCRLETVALPVSSSEIRQELAEGRVLAADLPASVAGYIHARGLYRSTHF